VGGVGGGGCFAPTEHNGNRKAIGMAQYLIVLSNWLHALATVVLIGHYSLLALIYWPALSAPAAPDLGRWLLRAGERAQPYLSGAVLVFIATGTLLMLVDDQYLGLGAIDNAWSWLLIIKHVLVLGLIALAIFADRTMLPRAANDPAALGRYRLAVWAITASGALVLLLTAMMQAE